MPYPLYRCEKNGACEFVVYGVSCRKACTVRAVRTVYHAAQRREIAHLMHQLRESSPALNPLMRSRERNRHSTLRLFHQQDTSVHRLTPTLLQLSIKTDSGESTCGTAHSRESPFSSSGLRWPRPAPQIPRSSTFGRRW